MGLQFWGFPAVGSLIIDVLLPSLNRPLELKRSLGYLLQEKGVFVFAQEETEPRSLWELYSQLAVRGSGDIVGWWADHLVPDIGCFDQIRGLFAEHFPDGNGAVGLHIVNKGRAKMPYPNSAFVFFGRKILDEFPDGQFICPDYWHYFGDTEFGNYLKDTGRFVYGWDAGVYSYHPQYGTADKDSTYQVSSNCFRGDEKTWLVRQGQGWLWGRDFNRVGVIHAN